MIDILPIQLRGREERFREPAQFAIADVLDDMLSAVVAMAQKHDRIALFGHCMGAVLAYEVAALLESNLGVDAVSLIVSGALSPGVRQPRLATGLPPAEFVSCIRANGYNHPALDDPELLEIVLPTLRADVALLEAYVPPRRAPLRAPIIAIRGRDDDHVSAAEIQRWAAYSRTAFSLLEPPGDHMYITQEPIAALRIVERVLRDATAP